MTYKRIYAKNEDYNTFKELKRNKQIELNREISDVEFFHMIIEKEKGSQNTTSINAKNICDGIAG
jgi:hypothetical protein